MENKPKLYIGTAGWTYKEWMPVFYPCSQSKELSWLQFYARYFNVVEINSTYYSLLNPRIIQSWLYRLNDVEDFVFTYKLHQNFTHKKNYTEEQANAIIQNLDLLQKEERLGGLLMQFPYSFACTDENIDYLRQLINIFETYPKFVEVKHPSWINRRAKSITFCSIDKPELEGKYPFRITVSNKTAYLRLYGRKQENSDERERFLYSPGELLEIESELKKIYPDIEKLFVIMKRHDHGNSIANAFEMMHYLKETKMIKMPETIIKAYPRLERLAKLNRADIPGLFRVDPDFSNN
ncbi:MAG: DUF72 domain-containing protein [Ignavibacteria bacterium]|jgi:uncharacterized protein YecE (DUF72 family)